MNEKNVINKIKNLFPEFRPIDDDLFSEFMAYFTDYLGALESSNLAAFGEATQGIAVLLNEVYGADPNSIESGVYFGLRNAILEFYAHNDSRYASLRAFLKESALVQLEDVAKMNV